MGAGGWVASHWGLVSVCEPWGAGAWRAAGGRTGEWQVRGQGHGELQGTGAAMSCRSVGVANHGGSHWRGGHHLNRFGAPGLLRNL